MKYDDAKGIIEWLDLTITIKELLEDTRFKCNVHVSVLLSVTKQPIVHDTTNNKKYSNCKGHLIELLT